jgi:hypothetical protein
MRLSRKLGFLRDGEGRSATWERGVKTDAAICCIVMHSVGILNFQTIGAWGDTLVMFLFGIYMIWGIPYQARRNEKFGIYTAKEWEKKIPLVKIGGCIVVFCSIAKGLLTLH